MRGEHKALKSQWSLRLSALLAVLCACGAGLVIGGHRAAVSAAISPAPEPIPWLPGESYNEGPRSDPRLDRPVQFWRAGLALREVFAEVREQTGVEIGFWPAGDANERVRVNLYLNPEDPPTLRALMSQLWWVTGCGFGYQVGADDTAPYRYYLLSTSIAGGAQTRLEQEWEEAMAALGGEWEAGAPSRDDVAERLTEYGEALRLTEDELVDRYYGVDDRLLANLLDPGRRAAVDFVLGLADESIDVMLDGERLTLDWRDLTPAQQDQLRSCLRSPGRPGRGGPWGIPVSGTGEQDWGDREVTQVHVGGLNYGQVILVAEVDTSDAESRGPRGRFLWAPMLDFAGKGELRPDEAIGLRRGLGEEVADEEARSLFDEWFESQRDVMRQQWESSTQDAIEAAAAETLPLSPDVETDLSSFTVPLEPEASYALWQIQQAVASATGMHVVSDCFFQPRLDLGEALRRLYPEEEVENTGLRVLRASCLTTEDLRGLVWAIPGDHRAGWEWQDAGSFLRFRSKARDLWRASMLPPEVQERLDGWLDAYMPASGQDEMPATSVDVTLDPQQISLTAAGLSDLQLEHGGKLICGDPAEKVAAHRQALRQEVLGAMSRASYALRALATLGGPQWEQLRGPGLRVGYDLTPEQKAAFGLSAEPGEGEAAGAPRGRRGRRGGAARGGRRGGGGPMFGRGGWGGPWGGRFGSQDEAATERLVIRLSEERPPRRGEQRRARPDEQRPERQGRERPGEERAAGPGEERPERRRGPGEDRDRRGWGGWLAKESSYLTFWLDEQPRGTYPIPRVVSVEMTPPTPLGQPVPLEPS